MSLQNESIVFSDPTRLAYHPQRESWEVDGWMDGLTESYLTLADRTGHWWRWRRCIYRFHWIFHRMRHIWRTCCMARQTVPDICTGIQRPSWNILRRQSVHLNRSGSQGCYGWKRIGLCVSSNIMEVPDGTAVGGWESNQGKSNYLKCFCAVWNSIVCRHYNPFLWQWIVDVPSESP